MDRTTEYMWVPLCRELRYDGQLVRTPKRMKKSVGVPGVCMCVCVISRSSVELQAIVCFD